MRLFGNIYGGEVALGVVTGLTIAAVPVPLYLLEWLLNLVQALIFSVLSLMFILLAAEGHEHEEGHPAADALDAGGDMPAHAMQASPSGA
jgi:membrane protein implicated in regulation of membrane protease activity